MLRRYVFVAVTAGAMVLGSVAPADAFMTSYELENPGIGTFEYDTTANPHWTFVPDGGPTYSGFFDKAKFGKVFAMKFEDKEFINKNGSPVEARLEGKTDRDCDHSRVEFKDKETGERWVLKLPFPGASQICNSSS
jgi:hypothetical protein